MKTSCKPKNSNRNLAAAAILVFIAVTPILSAAEPTVSANGGQPSFPTIKISGFARARADWMFSDASTPTMSVPNARIEIKATIAPDVIYNFSMDTVGGVLKLYDSYFSVAAGTLCKTRIGQFKYSFSREQATSDADLELINKSYAVADLASPTREIGAEISKSFSVAPLKPFVAIGGFNGAGPNADAQNNYGAATGRLLITPLDGFQVGGSYYDGRTGADKTDKRRHGFEAVYENRKAGPPILVKAEYLAGLDGKTDKTGGYLTAGYYFFPVKSWSSPSILTLARYDYFDKNTSASDDEISRITLGTVLQYNDFFSLRLNYEIRGETPSVDDNLLAWLFQAKF